MNVQKNIDRLLLALRMKGYNCFIDTKQFYSEKLDKMCTKYIVHEGNPREGEEFFSKMKVLDHLVFLYKSGDAS